MFLGIDVGTSGVKAVLVNEAGAIIATASHGLDLSHPAPLFSEQDPDAWVEIVVVTVPGPLTPLAPVAVNGSTIVSPETPVNAALSPALVKRALFVLVPLLVANVKGVLLICCVSSLLGTVVTIVEPPGRFSVTTADDVNV